MNKKCLGTKKWVRNLGRLTITLPFGADLLTLEDVFFSIYVVTVGPEVLVDV